MKPDVAGPSRQGFDLLSAGNPGKPNILVLTEHVNATYFISFDIPLRAMHARGELNFAVASQSRVEKLGEGCWETFNESFRPDHVVLTRYAQPFGVEMLHYFRAQGIPVIYHIDDDLLELPDSLGHDIRKRNGSWVVKESRRQMLAEADLVYASTPALAARLESRFPGQRVYHGIYASYPGDLSTGEGLDEMPLTIGYMGSRGHKEDLKLAVPAIVNLMGARPDLRFETFGTIEMPAELVEFEGRVRAHAVNKSYAGFLEVLASLGWAAGIAPLVDEPFNRCKAPTKFIEYTAAGIPVVASEVEVYRDAIRRGGALGAGGWTGPLVELVESPRRRAELVESARAYCRKAFAPATLERQVGQVLGLAGVRL